jgi:large subunit ribosomal protein L25
MSNQVTLNVEPRTDKGKGASGRLRRAGRTPGILYGYQVEPTSISVDALELYHALHTAAGSNVLLRVEVDGDEHLCVARDLQKHPVRGDVLHLDLLAVDKNTTISVEVPVSLVGEPEADGGVMNQVLYTVPILVPPLNTPNSLELDVEGMVVGDVRRVEDLRAVLPEGAEFDIDPERTVVTVNAPDLLEETDDEDEAAEGEAAPAAEAEGDEPAAEGDGDAEA